MPSYKYDSAYEWFCDYIGRNPGEAIAIAKELALKAGGDTIQDMFQSKMTEDGYFKKKYTLEEFTEKLESAIKQMDSYKEDFALDDGIDSPSKWLEIEWSESFESLYEDHGSDADEAIAYLGG